MLLLAQELMLLKLLKPSQVLMLGVVCMKLDSYFIIIINIEIIYHG